MRRKLELISAGILKELTIAKERVWRILHDIVDYGWFIFSSGLPNDWLHLEKLLRRIHSDLDNCAVCTLPETYQ